MSSGSGSIGHYGHPLHASANPSTRTNRKQRAPSMLGFDEMSMNRDGTVMTRTQILDTRIKRGYCETCGNFPTKCYDVKISFGIRRRMTARTTQGEVYKGICLRCRPDLAPAPYDPSDVLAPATSSRHGSTRSHLRSNSAPPSSSASHSNFVDPSTLMTAEVSVMTAEVSVVTAEVAVAPQEQQQVYEAHLHIDPVRPDVEVVHSVRRNLHASRPSLPRGQGSRQCVSTEEESAEVSELRDGMVPVAPESEGVVAAVGVSESGRSNAPYTHSFADSSSELSMVSEEDLDPEVLIELRDLVNDLLVSDSPETNEFAIENVSESMMANPDLISLQLYGAKFLSVMARKHRTNKELIIKNSGLDAIVKAMDNFHDDLMLQGLGAKTIWSLAVVQEHRAVIADAGGCHSMVEALLTHGADSSDVAEAVLGGMKPLVIDPRGREELEASSASVAVIGTMEGHQNVPKLQAEGCLILSNLVFDRMTSRVSVASPDEIRCIVKAMIKFVDDEAVQKQAWSALYNYSFSKTNLLQILELDPVEREKLQELGRRYHLSWDRQVEDVLDRLRTTEEGLSSGEMTGAYSEQNGYSNGADFDQEALAQLEAVASGLDSESEKINTVCVIMMEFPESNSIQIAGLRCLEDLSRMSTENCDFIAQYALAMVMFAMENHRQDDVTQLKGVIVMGNLVTSSENNRIEVINAGGADRIIDSMRDYLNFEAMQVAGLTALEELTNPSSVKLPHAKGILSLVSEIMCKHTESDIIQERACIVLKNVSTNLSQHSEEKSHTTTANGLDVKVAATVT